MGCKEAMEIIKEWGEATIRGKEVMGLSGDVREAFRHIRECREEKCHQIWMEFNGVIRNIDHNIELLSDENGLLPFSY